MDDLTPEYFTVEGAPAGLWMETGRATMEQSKARGIARDAAEARVRALNQEGEAEWISRWEKAESRYCVKPAPFDIPKEPWGDFNKPIHRSPNREKRPSQFMPLDDLLIAAGTLGIFQWAIANERPANAKQVRDDLQAALDAQYGRGHFFAYRHGNSISVQCRYPLPR